MVIIPSLSDDRVANLFLDDAVGIIPTDTVYGLACLARSRDAVERLYRTKQREHKPGTVIAANIEQLIELGIKRRYLKAVEQYWPNPLSVVLPDSPELEYLDQGKKSLAVRIPDHPKLHALLLKTGPLLTTSANMPGEPVSTTIEEAQARFGDAIDFYVNGGDLSGIPSSTVIRVIDDAIEVLRQGAVIVDSAAEQ